MKQIIYLSIILILNFTTLTCFPQAKNIRISNTKSLYWQVEVYGGINRHILETNNNSAYAMNGVSVKLKRQISENRLYINGGVSVEENNIAKNLLNKNDNFASFDYISIGIPLSIGFAALNNPRMSLYATCGCIPMVAIFNNIKVNDISQDNKLSFLLAPQIEGGMYINYEEYKIKLGAFARRFQDISKESCFSMAGRMFGGLSLGVVF